MNPHIIFLVVLTIIKVEVECVYSSKYGVGVGVGMGSYSTMNSGSDINILDKCIAESVTSTFDSNSNSNSDNNNNNNNNYNSGHDISLQCQLGTINSEFERVNLSSLPGDILVSLRMDCSQHIFYQSALEKSSLSHLNRLASLHIEHCKLSRLPEKVFSGLVQLRNLTVRTHNTAWPALSLDIGSGVFNGLPRLDRIDLSANNIWTFPQFSFCGLANSLRVLNVSRNRLQDLSALSFNEITERNLPGSGSSAAAFKRSQIASALSSSSSCHRVQMGLEILDISSNRLLLLPPHGLSKLGYLRELYLQYNEITLIASEALSKLKRLQILDLSGNKLEQLPAALFQDNTDIQEIYLRNNSLNDLNPSIFANLGQLLVLDLSKNKLTFTQIINIKTAAKDNNNNNNNSSSENSTTITTTSAGAAGNSNSIFSSLIRLVNLDLSHNRLTHLTSAILGNNLFSLQILNLDHNEISLIEGNTFTALKNLHTLTLSHNKLTFIDSTTFNGLFVLTFLSLDNNLLDSIHPNAFHNNSNIRDINLNGNQFTSVPSAVQNLTFLKTLDLGENSIVELDDTAKTGTGSGAGVKLVGLPNLYGLRLTGNQIANVSTSFFKELSSLKIVNLARNKIHKLQPGTFDNNYNLQAVRVDANYLQDISGLFDKLPNLLWLNVSDNNLGWFDYSVIPRQLKWLDLHKNEIVQLDNGSGGSSLELRLQTLDASFNKLTRLSSSSIPDSIENLHLNDNLIQTIEASTFYNKVNLSRVDLSMNQLETLDEVSIQLQLKFHNQHHSQSQSQYQNQLPEFYLSQNPFTCDCHLEWLQKINQRAMNTRQFPLVQDLDHIYCMMPYHQSASVSLSLSSMNNSPVESQSQNQSDSPVLPLQEISPDQFICPYSSHCPEACHCCDFESCDCKMQCPAGCTCYHDNQWQVNIVDCSSSSGTGENQFQVESGSENTELSLSRKTVPSSIPMDSTVIYLDGNDLSILPSHVFIGRKNLERLFLNHSRISILSNNSFSGLRSLHSLFLQSNHLREILGYEFAPLENLRELYLHNNQISFISPDSFSQLKQLTHLSLSGNRLSHFPLWSLQINHRLINIRLGNNPWTCECDFVSVAVPWIQSNAQRIGDLQGVKCVSGQAILQVNASGTGCSSSNSNSNSNFNFNAYNIFKVGGGGGGSNRNYNDESENASGENVDNEIDSDHYTNANANAMEKNRVSLSSDNNNNNGDSSSDNDMFPYLPSLLAIGAVILFVSSVFVAVCRKKSCLRDWLSGSFSASGGATERSATTTTSSSWPSSWSSNSLSLLSCCCPSNATCLPKNVDGEQDKLFDAYIAYSANDEVWVSQILATNIQNSVNYSDQSQQNQNQPYRLCLHYRDFVMTAYIADTIVEAVESSKRTIIVLSKNFLQSEWTSFEFKSALHTAIRSGGNHMKNRLVIVTLGDITTRDLDPDLRVMLRYAIVLQANDKLFWEKLKNSMPEPRAPTAFHHQNQQQNSQTWRSQKSNSNIPPVPIPHQNQNQNLSALNQTGPQYYDINERVGHHNQNSWIPDHFLPQNPQNILPHPHPHAKSLPPLPPPLPPFPIINPLSHQAHHLHPLPQPNFQQIQNQVTLENYRNHHHNHSHSHSHHNGQIPTPIQMTMDRCPHGLMSVSSTQSHHTDNSANVSVSVSDLDKTQYSYVESA